MCVIFSIAIVIFICLERQPYYKKYHYIAHALGGIDDIDYTNSKEALETAYSNGYRLFEADFVFTSDKRMVCRHKWSNDLGDDFSEENIPDYQTYMSSKIFDKYTPVDIDTIMNFAKEHPEVYFITDLKSYKTEMKDMLAAIEESANKIGYKEYREKFIIQFYSYESYKEASENYSFQNYIFTLYRMTDELGSEKGINEILDFCIENDIEVITIPKKYATEEICKKIKDKNISIYTHTINDKKVWEQLYRMGVDGIYTDYIHPYRLYKLR